MVDNTLLHPHVRQLKKYIDEHLCEEELSVNTAMYHCNLTNKNIPGRFRQEIGQTPGSYIRCARIEQAKQLLIQAEKCKIADIAFQIGYGSHEAFTRAFKKATGYAPCEYAAAFRDGRGRA